MCSDCWIGDRGEVDCGWVGTGVGGAAAVGRSERHDALRVWGWCWERVCVAECCG